MRMRAAWAVVALVSVTAACSSGRASGDAAPPSQSSSAAARPADARAVTFEVDSPDGLVTGADLTFGLGGDVTQNNGAAVPLTRKDGTPGVRLDVPDGQALSVLAQNKGSAGQIRCRILAEDGSVIDENVSSGAYAITSCHGVAR